jgi:hypothetical protein
VREKLGRIRREIIVRHVQRMPPGGHESLAPSDVVSIRRPIRAVVISVVLDDDPLPGILQVRPPDEPAIVVEDVLVQHGLRQPGPHEEKSKAGFAR